VSARTVRDSDISVVFEAGSDFASGFRAYCLPGDIAPLVEGAFRIGYDAPGVCVSSSDIELDEKLLRVRGTLARVAGQLVVTETKTPRSRHVVPLSPTAERLLRDVRTNQRAERLRTGSMW
jgi:hypothetical protein